MLRQVAGVVCVGAYLLGGTETLPQLLAVSAWVEGSHKVQVAQDGQQMTVVLSHQGRLGWQPERAPCHQTANFQHRHGPATRLFCFFATPAPSKADHVASFASGPVSEYMRSVLEPKAKGNAAPSYAAGGAKLCHEPAAAGSLPGTAGAWLHSRPREDLALLGWLR